MLLCSQCKASSFQLNRPTWSDNRLDHSIIFPPAIATNVNFLQFVYNKFNLVLKEIILRK